MRRAPRTPHRRGSRRVVELEPVAWRCGGPERALRRKLPRLRGHTAPAAREPRIATPL